MIEIPLTKGFVAIVDDEDAHLARHNWFAFRGRYTWYAARKEPKPGGGQRTVCLHREVLGAPARAQVDHCDGNGLDCRRHNLRLASGTQNQGNRRLNRNNKSGFKGVFWYKARGKWTAAIKVGKRRPWLGLFDAPEDAARAYDAAARAAFGEFARTNFPAVVA